MPSSVEPIASFLDSPLTLRVQRATHTIPREVQWRLYIATLIIGDLIITGLAFWFAYEIRFYSDIPVFRVEVVPEFPFYRRLSFLMMAIWLVIYASNGLYQKRNLLGGFQEYSLLFRATGIGIALVIITGFLAPDFILARGWLLLSWALAFLLVGGFRFGLRRVVYKLRQHGYFLSPTLIVGANDEACALAEQLAGWRTSGLHVLGFVDNECRLGTPIYKELHNIGTTEHLDGLIERFRVEEIVIATSALTRAEMLDIFRQYGMDNRLNLRLSSGLFEIITTGLEVKEVAYVPLVRVNRVRLTGFDRILKLMLDYSIALPGLIAIAPMLVFIAIAIKLDSPGPVFHRRRVVGLNGKIFHAYKFRTMHINGDEILDNHPELKEELAKNHKLKKDPRVTKIGAFLRKYSLDELPQLINVVRRQMSLVGPRMITPAEMDEYAQWGTNLLTVMPGITGLWQVSGRSDISYADRVRLDMQYIRNWTIWLDIQLITQTPGAVLRARGAY